MNTSDLKRSLVNSERATMISPTRFRRAVFGVTRVCMVLLTLLSFSKTVHAIHSHSATERWTASANIQGTLEVNGDLLRITFSSFTFTPSPKPSPNKPGRIYEVSDLTNVAISYVSGSGSFQFSQSGAKTDSNILSLPPSSGLGQWSSSSGSGTAYPFPSHASQDTGVITFDGHNTQTLALTVEGQGSGSIGGGSDVQATVSLAGLHYFTGPEPASILLLGAALPVYFGKRIGVVARRRNRKE